MIYISTVILEASVSKSSTLLHANTNIRVVEGGVAKQIEGFRLRIQLLLVLNLSLIEGQDQKRRVCLSGSSVRTFLGCLYDTITVSLSMTDSTWPI